MVIAIGTVSSRTRNMVEKQYSHAVFWSRVNLGKRRSHTSCCRRCGVVESCIEILLLLQVRPLFHCKLISPPPRSPPPCPPTKLFFLTGITKQLLRTGLAARCRHVQGGKQATTRHTRNHDQPGGPEGRLGPFSCFCGCLHHRSVGALTGGVFEPKYSTQ